LPNGTVLAKTPLLGKERRRGGSVKLRIDLRGCGPNHPYAPPLPRRALPNETVFARISPPWQRRGEGVVRSTSEQICVVVDRTTPNPSFAKEGNCRQNRFVGQSRAMEEPMPKTPVVGILAMRMLLLTFLITV